MEFNFKCIANLCPPFNNYCEMTTVSKAYASYMKQFSCNTMIATEKHCKLQRGTTCTRSDLSCNVAKEDSSTFLQLATLLQFAT